MAQCISFSKAVSSPRGGGREGATRPYAPTPIAYRAGKEVELLPGFETATATDELLVEIQAGSGVLSNDYPGGQGSNDMYGYYRYGFNGKENDNEVKGAGNQQDYGLRIYDPRIGRFLSVDPLTRTYPWYTPYQFAGNRPIDAIDLDGGEPQGFMEHWQKVTDPYMTKWNFTVQTIYDSKTKQEWSVMHYPNTDEYYYYDPKFEGAARIFDPYNLKLNKDGTEWTGRFKQFIPSHLSDDKSFNYLMAGVLTVPFVVVEAIGTISLEALGRFVVEEAVEAAFESVTGIPVIMNPGDILEKGFRAVLRDQVKDQFVEKYGKEAVEGFGSYTIKYADGTTYHGAGNLEEAFTRAYKKSTGPDDVVTTVDWTPSASRAQQFRDEAKRLNDDGGFKSPTNRNQTNSPGNVKYKDPANDKP